MPVGHGTLPSLLLRSPSFQERRAQAKREADKRETPPPVRAKAWWRTAVHLQRSAETEGKESLFGGSSSFGELKNRSLCSPSAARSPCSRNPITARTGSLRVCLLPPPMTLSISKEMCRLG